MRRMFSEQQIKTLISNAIKENVISLYQDYDIASLVSFRPGSLTGLEFTTGYCKIRKSYSDNMLHIILNFSIKNTTESSISMVNQAGVFLNFASLPEIASKIYDVNGDTVADAIATDAGITSETGYTDAGYPTAGFNDSRVFAMINGQTANLAFIVIRNGGNIPAGVTWNYTFRLALSL